MLRNVTIAACAAAVLALAGLAIHEMWIAPPARERGAPAGGGEEPGIFAISHGEEVDLDAHVRKRGLTVVEFGAVW
jgi:hypothetical protein